MALLGGERPGRGAAWQIPVALLPSPRREHIDEAVTLARLILEIRRRAPALSSGRRERC